MGTPITKIVENFEVAMGENLSQIISQIFCLPKKPLYLGNKKANMLKTYIFLL